MRSTWTSKGYDQWLGLLRGAGYAIRFKVTVTNVSTAETVELTNLEGQNWVRSVTWGDDTDSPGPTLTMTLQRSFFRMHLAPTADDSASNKLVFPGDLTPYLSLTGRRKVKLDVQAVAPGGAVDSTRWEVAFDGYLDAIDWSFGSNELTIECRDLAAREQDTFIETERVYGSTGGTALKTVMQSIASDNGVAVTIVNVGTAPTWNLHPYTQARTNVHDALRTLALQIGYDYRYWYDAASDTFKPSLVYVERALGTERTTFGQLSGLVRDVRGLKQSLEQVRNVVSVAYLTAAGVRSVVTASNAGSITNYGRRFMELAEGAAMNIDSGTEANALAAAVLSDLKEPAFEFELDTPLFPWWELYDLELYQFVSDDPSLFTMLGNNWNLVFACMAYSHTIDADGKHSTSTRWRRSVQTGPRMEWLGQEARPGVGQAMPSQSDPASFAFRGYRSSTQAISTGTLTKVSFNAEDFDLGGAFDTSTGIFLVPRTGVYTLQTGVTLASMPDKAVAQLSVYVTPSGGAAAEYFRGNFTNDTGGTSDLAMQLSLSTVALNVNDQVEVRVKHATGASQNVAAGVGNTFFAMKRAR